jgi:hypothetical protein
MRCNEFEQYLERGQENVPADASSHLNSCTVCRTLVEDLQAIQSAARELGSDSPTPPERIWISLRAQLEEQGLIRPTREAERSRPSGRWGFWARPALAGAYLALVLTVVVLINMRSKIAPTQSTVAPAPISAVQPIDQQLKAEERRASRAIHGHNPVMTASLRENLDIVDNLIAMCEKTVQKEPQSQMARDYLNGAYQQKAELLAAMIDRGAKGD